MPNDLVSPSRRDVLAGFGSLAGASVLSWRGAAGAATSAAIALRLAPAEAALRGPAERSPVWDFVGPALPRLTEGDVADVTVTNDLPVPVVLTWRGCGGGPEAEPLLAREPLPPGRSSTIPLQFHQSGTALCDARLLGDGQPGVLPACGLVVGERRPPAVDADHLVAVADWRIRPDGTLAAPGTPATDATTVFTANGTTALDVPVQRHARLRFRFINCCHRTAIALKLENHDVRVVAIDGRPAAPFVARDGQLMLAPGTRIDALVDATGQPGTTASLWLHDGISPRPLGRLLYAAGDPLRPAALPPPSPLADDGQPQHLALASAQRVELDVNAEPGSGVTGWQRPAAFVRSNAPAFRARRGRTVVLALTNHAATPVTFHLHGHHVRWLDRLDDGWKPFWLDTLLLPAGQSIRVAFLAEHTGAWLLEAMGTDWAAPRLVHWYAVD